MDIRTSVLIVIYKFNDFTGRAQRAEYWLWYFAVSLAGGVLAFADTFIFSFDFIKIGVLQLIFYLIVATPYMAVAARRLHDVNKSGWWQLLLIVPLFLQTLIINAIVDYSLAIDVRIALIPTFISSAILLYWLAEKGTCGPNRFGPDPLIAPGLGYPTSSTLNV